VSRRFGALLALSFWVGGAARASAQDESDETDEDTLNRLGYGRNQSGPGAEVNPAGAKPESERTKRLKTLAFDRRPSTVLETWARPPEPEPAAKPADAAAPPAEPAAAPPENAPPENETEDARKARETAEKAKAEAAAKAAAKAEEAKQLDRELKQFQRQVTLGAWDEVAAYLKGLTPEEGKAGYAQLLRSLLQVPPPRPPFNPQMQNWVERNQFTLSDLVALARLAPVELDKETEKSLGALLVQGLKAGSLLDRFLALARAEVAREGSPLKARNVARILMAAGYPEQIAEFLPSPEEAVAKNDREGLNLLSRHFLAMHKKEAKGGWLEKAWSATLSALEAGEITEDDKKEALKLAVEIAPNVRAELGQKWLNDSFTSRPERGMEILAAIGASASEGFTRSGPDADARLRGLKLQTTATEALLGTAPELGTRWRAALELLATNWLKEAVFSQQRDPSTQRGPRMRRDYYGNFYYYGDDYVRTDNQTPTPIPTGKLLEVRPSDRWLDHVEEGIRPKFAMVTAELLLKVGEEREAFPYIERLAATHAREAKGLTDEFLRVWARNHNPNEQSSRSNSYTYFYGFEERSNGIPLTRSKQARNLTELGEWVKRLRALPIERLDQKLLSTAFTSAHSTAEVYRLADIEQVFGSLDDLEPATLAGLVQQMRTNLVGVWRRPDVQKDKKTNRGPKEIQAEVLRGYDVARSVVDAARSRHPEEWSLALARASLDHDENNFRGELEKSADFSARRHAAFESFQAAADLYAKQVAALPADEESADAYLTWYYAALGACDLAAVDHEKVLAADQVPRIRAALESLGSSEHAEIAKRHRTLFATTLFSRMGSVNPAVKFRYVREGLEIVGNDESAAEAREVYDYYKDLVTEIRLEARIDGGDVVGHDEPFGLFVDLRHTREIERESGGFAKYLTNQNNQSFSYNYGRPTENYRDSFEEAARETLKEHFEVLSITFNRPETTSIAEPEYGWRRTPYAYLLLKPRGPEVDKVPSLRLDLDFLDTSGYAVLPVESSAVAIDARGKGEPRPFRDLHVTQTLDERQAKEGKLVLEIKAKAHGLLPAWNELVDLRPEGFDVAKVDDSPVSVVEFDKEAAATALLCERSWMISLEGRAGLAKLPTSFAFGTSKVEGAELDFQRFVDADLAKAEPVVSLEQRYGTRRPVWPKIAGFGAAGVVLVVGVVLLLRRRPRRVEVGRFQRPASVTPFTTIALLQDIARDAPFRDGEREELDAQIDALERYYFVEEEGDAPDLDSIVTSWIERSR